MDGAARQGTRQTQTDENHHLAKVRVAGSNPVFRSNGARSGPVFKPPTALTPMGFSRDSVNNPASRDRLLTFDCGFEPSRRAMSSGRNITCWCS